MLEKANGGLLKVHVRAEDGQVRVEFHDSGVGIEEANRIFEPFYTTKRPGKGTGLGLSICYGIVQEHGGTITAHNRQEGGAVIGVSLPAASQQALPEPSPPAPHPDRVLQGKILLLEPEDAVREFERDLLVGAGAEVVTATDEEAVKSVLKSQSLAAVILDGKMSNGCAPPEICPWISENCPEMEKHLMFTFSTLAEPEVRSFLNERKIPMLVKPFEVADLVAQIRRLTQQTEAAGAT
jgi:two-component system NtrC family sensor kinase